MIVMSIMCKGSLVLSWFDWFYYDVQVYCFWGVVIVDVGWFMVLQVGVVIEFFIIVL